MYTHCARRWVLSGFALFVSSACQDQNSLAEPETVPVPPVLVVSNITTGGAFDLDGVAVNVDGGGNWPLELNEAITLGNVAVGPHIIELGGLASNCSVSGEARRLGTLAQGVSTRVEFEIVCVPPPDLAIVRFIFSHSPRRVAEGSRIVAMNADGSERVDLTDGQFIDYGPEISSDGGRIVFMRECRPGRFCYGIYSMNADGSAVGRTIEGSAYEPAWAPDGQRLAFLTYSGGHWGGLIHVSRADGSEATPFMGSASSGEDDWPAWSPDGTRIAFSRWESERDGISIWTADPDGSKPVRLTGSGRWGPLGPVWSPDGRIAYSRADGFELTSRIHVMNADGSAVTTLLESDVHIQAHDWSSDGRFLLFTKSLPTASPRTDIYLLRIVDRSLIRLTAAGLNRDPAFFWPRPDE
jgi:Tol biopolymer transport system component